MLDLKQFEIWFVTGSQDLYGAETLLKVDEHSKIISEFFDKNSEIPVRVVFKPVVKSCLAAKLGLPLLLVLRKTDTVDEAKFVTTKSALPSPSKSPMATE